MRLIPVAIVIFYRIPKDNVLEVWTQFRHDDGPYHGLQEFPGGGVEKGETPLMAALREVEEEVGIKIDGFSGKFMGIYNNEFPGKNILLNVFLFPDPENLPIKGKWLEIKSPELSLPFKGIIPGPNHQMIDDLYRSLYSGKHE